MIIIPYGGTTPAQDAKIEKMVDSMMNDPNFKKKYPDAKKRKSHAIAIAKSKVMGKEGLVLENVPFEFSVPFLSESLAEGDTTSRKVKGRLLYDTTSRNKITYEAKEINEATFNGAPYDESTELTMSINHTDDVMDNVGLWKPIRSDGNVDFEAKVYNTHKHPNVTEMLDKKLIRFVSVEAIAKKLVDSGDSYKAEGLDITGMGIVKTPGIIGASAALAEAFNEINGDRMEEKTEVQPIEVKVDVSKLEAVMVRLPRRLQRCRSLILNL